MADETANPFVDKTDNTQADLTGTEGVAHVNPTPSTDPMQTWTNENPENLVPTSPARVQPTSGVVPPPLIDLTGTQDRYNPRAVENIGVGGHHWREYMRQRQERMGVPLTSNQPHNPHAKYTQKELDAIAAAHVPQEYPKALHFTDEDGRPYSVTVYNPDQERQELDLHNNIELEENINDGTA